MAISEGVNGSGVPERAARLRPIKAQSAAVARATASICNAEWARYGGTSGHGGFVHTFSRVELAQRAAQGCCDLGLVRMAPARAHMLVGAQQVGGTGQGVVAPGEEALAVDEDGRAGQLGKLGLAGRDDQQLERPPLRRIAQQ